MLAPAGAPGGAPAGAGGGAPSLAGLACVAAGTVAVVALHVAAAPFIMPALRKHCLPYIAANAVQVELVGDACLRRGVKRVVDLGSGDGVVCVSLARRLGIEAVGYELNPWLVAYSRANARWHGVQHLAKFHCKNLFHADVRQADAVVLFVVPAMMTDIAAKLDMEMKDDACVLAGRFPMKPCAHAASLRRACPDHSDSRGAARARRILHVYVGLQHQPNVGLSDQRPAALSRPSKVV